MLERPPDRLGERELTRQNDLARLTRLAEEFDDGVRDVAAFVEHLERRFGPGGENRGVHLLTYHRAKGLEFDAVYLPRLEERELPCRQAKTRAAVDEERRLFYVGMTRAKRLLHITWTATPSRFLKELGVATAAAPRRRPSEAELPPVFGDLKSWRLARATLDGIPPYVVFHDTTLAEIAVRRPGSASELATVAGVGPAKLERYGKDVLAVLARVRG